NVEYLWLPNFALHQYISHKVESKLPIPKTTGGLPEKGRRRIGGKQEENRKPPAILPPIGIGTVVGTVNEVGIDDGTSASPPQPPTAGASLDLQGWVDRFASSDNHVGILGEMITTLRGGEVSLSRLASVLGGIYYRDAGNMARVIWENKDRQIAGDFLSYVKAVKKGQVSEPQGPRDFEEDAATYARWTQGKERGIPPSPLSEKGGDGDTER
ncbi:hypothetical protein LCGC14_1430190, partial [marine sediment metagenome]